jgi:predicted methyltransferase
MRNLHVSSRLLAASLFTLAACGGEPAPATPPPPPPAETSATPPPAPPPEPTPEEKKKAEQAKKLEDQKARWKSADDAELARWTPEMHAEAKKLADTKYATGAAAVKAALAGHQRKPGDADRDKYRHPLETLSFFGLQPNMTVIDLYPGEGWYTEILAPALAAKGKLIDVGSDPHGPEESSSTWSARHYQAFLDKAPELYGKVQVLPVDGKAPSLGLDGTVDMVLVMREMHNMVPGRAGTIDKWLAEIHKALKPKGILAIVDHRAAKGSDPAVTAKNGYLPEAWVIAQVEAAGFKLVKASDVNANPKDTKDYPDGVWTLPPSFAGPKEQHDRFAAIGESDRMTLKFVKK